MPSRSLTIELSWPAEQLSPNSRAHRMVKHRYAKAAKTEAGWATKLARPFDWAHDGPLAIRITAYPPLAWRAGDRDNLVGRLKSHLDAIAAVLGVNDRQFESPAVTWADRCERGRVEIEVTPI